MSAVRGEEVKRIGYWYRARYNFFDTRDRKGKEDEEDWMRG